MSRKPCINTESNTRISPFIYTVIVLTTTMKFLSVITPPDIYHGSSTWKTLWEDKLPPVKMTSYGRRNVRKHRETKKGEQYIVLEIYLKVDCLKNREFNYS